MKLIAQVPIGSTFFGPGGAGFREISSVSGLVSLFLKISLVIAGIILLFYFLLGGFGMVAGAGKNDPKQMEQAKATLTTGITGLVLVVLAYWIVQLILQVLGLPKI